MIKDQTIPSRGFIPVVSSSLPLLILPSLLVPVGGWNTLPCSVVVLLSAAAIQEIFPSTKFISEQMIVQDELSPCSQKPHASVSLGSTLDEKQWLRYALLVVLLQPLHIPVTRQLHRP